MEEEKIPSRFMTFKPVLEFLRNKIDGTKCLTTRELRRAHFGQDAQKNVKR